MTNLPYERIFAFSSLLVVPFWALMILAPGWSWTRRIVASPLVVAPAALLYAGLVLPGIVGILPELANPDLTAIAALLGTPAGATAAWAHFLTFDLFVGRWVYLDARARSVPAWAASPVLVLVFMFGPLGLLLHLLVRAVLGAAGRPAGEAADAAT